MADTQSGDRRTAQTGRVATTRPARVLAVLGMHRSGTSYLTGSLQQHGLFLGKHRISTPSNRRGNRENDDILALHERILRDSGGVWDAPPPVAEWRPEHYERAMRILAEYAENDIWGFKDPRTVLTLSGWQELVPDLGLVGIFRHPLAVAQSLRRRDDMPAEKAFGLWAFYNQRLLDAQGTVGFPLLSFDENPATLEEKLLEVVSLLGLDPTPPEDPFFSEELRRPPVEHTALPAAVERLYVQLQAVAT